MPQNPKSQNLSSDDTPAERQAKLDAAADREREAAAEAAEEKRKADEKAAAEAERKASRKATAANPQVSFGSEPHNPKAPQTSLRPAETVKAGESGVRKSSQLSRAQMEEVIKAGGSVMYKGVIIKDAGHLPAAADLVAGDEVASKAVAKELDTQIEALQKQRDKLPK